MTEQLSSTRAGYTLNNRDARGLVILLHGLGGDRMQPLDAFGDFGPELTVLAPDQRAHGETTADVDPDLLTFHALADDVVALVEATGQAGKPVYLAGISMGAAVSLNMLRRGLLDIRGASLVRPAFGAAAVPDNLAMMPMIASLLRIYGPRDGAAILAASTPYRALVRQSPTTAVSLLEQFDKFEALHRIARLTVIPSQRAYTSAEDLAGIDVPVQVVGAHGDPLHPLALAREWSDLIPSASLVNVVSRDVDADGYSRALHEAVTGHAKASFE